MLRNLTIIFIIATLFGAFLVIRPYISGPKENPVLVDRLPDAEFMAQLNPLQLAKEMRGLLFYHKIPYRDFISEEFFLSQAKGFGINFQNPVYAFGDQEGSFGVISELTDSSKVLNGVKKLMHFFDMSERKINGHKVYKFQNFDGYLTYSKDFILFYIGDQPKTIFDRVYNAKSNQVSPNWINFFNVTLDNTSSFKLYSRIKDFQTADVNYILSTPAFDSSKVYIQTLFNFNDQAPFALKDNNRGIASNPNSNKEIQLHIDPTYLKQNKQHPINTLLAKMAKKVSFPYWEFLRAWQGDLSLQQGGWVTIQEEFITTEVDDDFNITEVVKTQEAKIPGFSCFLTLDNQQANLQRILENRGLLTNQEDGWHFLFSPPLKYIQNKLEHLYYATKAKPKLEEINQNYVRWPYAGTDFHFTIDSLVQKTVYTNLSFSPEKMLMKQLK